MRRSSIKKALFASLAVLWLACPAFGAQDPSVREYSSVEIRLIDHASGYMGIVETDETTGTEKKFSVKADPVNVDVRNSLSRILEFKNLGEGDLIDLVTRADASGAEEVLEIFVYGKFAE